MQKVGLTITTLAFLAIGTLLFLGQNTQKMQTLHARLGGEAFVLEIADTTALRARGLSGHAPLGSREGMIFIFPVDDKHKFWMKDMLFPIDILWLDSAYRIVDVKKGATPASYPELFTPAVPARYVVEIPAGFFEEHHLNVGDTLEILK